MPLGGRIEEAQFMRIAFARASPRRHEKAPATAFGCRWGFWPGVGWGRPNGEQNSCTFGESAKKELAVQAHSRLCLPEGQECQTEQAGAEQQQGAGFRGGGRGQGEVNARARQTKILVVNDGQDVG